MRHRILNAPIGFAALLAVSAAPGLSLASNQTSDEANTPDHASVQQEFSKAFAAIKDFSAEQRDEAVAKTEALLAELDAELEEQQSAIQANWQSMTEATREESRDALRALKQERNDLAEWLGGIKHGSDEAWDDMVNGFTAAYADFTDAWAKYGETGEGDVADRHQK